jgi:hypothetical protein
LHSPQPRWPEAVEHALKSALQRLCASLPAAIGRPIYRLLRAAKDWSH